MVAICDRDEVSKIKTRCETNLPFQNVARWKKIYHLEAKLKTISNMYKWTLAFLVSGWSYNAGDGHSHKETQWTSDAYHEGM